MELSEVEVPKQLAELAGRIIKDESQDANKDKQRTKWPRFRLEVEASEPILSGCYLKLKDGRYKKDILELAEKRSKEEDDINEYMVPEAYDVDGGVNAKLKHTSLYLIACPGRPENFTYISL
ncbi:unnamed protein product [Rhodiola kirilowii]